MPHDVPERQTAESPDSTAIDLPQSEDSSRSQPRDPSIADKKDDEEERPLLNVTAVRLPESAIDNAVPSSSGFFGCIQNKGLLGAVWSSGVCCMAIASFIQSLQALFVKLTHGRVPVFEIVGIRSGMCLAATVAVLRMRNLSPIFGTRDNLAPLFIRGLAGATSMSLYYFAIFRLSLADVITLFFTHPAMVVGLAWAFRGEKVGLGGILGMLLSLAGVMLVAQPPFLTGGSEWSAQHLIGVGLCLGAAFLAAVAFVSIRFVQKSVPSLTIALWFHVMGVATAVPPLLLGVPSAAVIPEPFDMLMILGIGSGSFISHAFLARAFLVDNASKIAAVGYLQVVFAHIYSIALLHDPESLLGVSGSLVICVGVVAVNWPKKSADEPSSGGKTETAPLTGATGMAPEGSRDDESATVELSALSAEEGLQASGIKSTNPAQ